MKLIDLYEDHQKDFNLKTFEEECKPFLNELKGSKSLPYHGTHPTIDYTIRTFQPRTASRDTPDHLHDAMNFIARERFGHEIRNWMFVTGAARDARVYGKVHVIIPIGSEFHYVWSMVDDMASLSYSIRQKHRNDPKFQDLSWEERTKKADIEFVNSLKEMEFKVDKDLPAALESQHEIHLSCGKFYMFNVLGPTFTNIVEPFLRKNYMHQQSSHEYHETN